MIVRRPWGYTCHVAGSCLVAVTCFGLIYTIPALAFALSPEFKAYFYSPKASKPALQRGTAP